MKTGIPSVLAWLLFLAMIPIRAVVTDSTGITKDEINMVLETGGVGKAVERYVEWKIGLPAGGQPDITPFLQAAADAFTAGKRAAAIDLLEKIKELSPGEIGVYRVLGQLYWYSEQRDSCVSNFRKCLEADPNDRTAGRYWDLLFFVPEEFRIPESLSTGHLRLRLLRATDVDLDYKAVMGSRAHLRGTFGPDDDWPADDLTLEDDLMALKKHEKESLRRLAFTYTVMDPEGSECLGCVYILPAHTALYDASVYLWVTEEAYRKGYDRELYEGVKTWLKKEWPFPSVVFPGREIDWATWEKIQY